MWPVPQSAGPFAVGRVVADRAGRLLIEWVRLGRQIAVYRRVRHVPQGRPMGRVGELSAGQSQGRISHLHRRSLLAQPVGACAVLEVVGRQDRMKRRPF